VAFGEALSNSGALSRSKISRNSVVMPALAKASRARMA